LLLKREPELAQLQSEVLTVKDEGSDSFCANKMWFVYFGPRLNELVGKRARSNDPILRSEESYELAHQILYKLLPNCRNCICVPW
jgi:hypothetical protein